MSRTPRKLKRIAVGLLFVPLGFFLLFTFGEVFSGDLTGLSHLIQAIPVVILIVLAIKKPLIAGVLLTLLSITLGLLYAFKVPFEITTILIVELFIFVPPLVSGLLLVLSSKKNNFFCQSYK